MLRAHRRAARLAVHSAAVAATKAAPRARDVEALVADARTTLRLWGLDAEAVDLSVEIKQWPRPAWEVLFIIFDRVVVSLAPR